MMLLKNRTRSSEKVESSAADKKTEECNMVKTVQDKEQAEVNPQQELGAEA